MKKSVLISFVLFGLVLLAASCKVVEPVAKDATFYQWRWNQLRQVSDDAYTQYGANFIITGESVSRDTALIYVERFYRESETYGNIQCVTLAVSKTICDIYMKDGHTYITGAIISEHHNFDEADWDGSVYHNVKTTVEAYPFLEIDGIIRDITPKDPRVKDPNGFCGLRFITDGNKLYIIIGGNSEIRELPQGRALYTDYYVSEEGGEPYYIGSFDELSVGDIAKVGNEWYVCGRWSTSACYQSNTEVKTFIAPLEHGGMLHGVIDYHGEPLMVGRMGGYPIIFYHDTITNLPGNDSWVYGEALFAKMINDDLYIGGYINNHPALWKNNELVVLLKELPKGFRYLFFTDVEVVGDMIYVVGEGLYKENDTYHSAFFKLKDTGELIQEYDEYDDLVTSVEVMKWIGNTTWQNVVWHVEQGVFDGWKINKPRILLKY